MKFNSNLILSVILLLFVNIYVSNATPVEYVAVEKRNIFDDIVEKAKEVAEKVVSTIAHGGNNIAVKLGINTAKYGAMVLNMKEDENGVYHADFNCWQKYFGYNKFYDYMFDLGTSMEYNNEGMFNYNGENYILWAWKGDYINLGAGAELGIYKGGNGKDSHWEAAPEDAMPMTLTLTHKTKGTIVNNWTNNGENSWWITAFNPKYQNVDATDLTATYTVKFTNSGMYQEFEKTGAAGWTFDSATQTATLVL